MKTVYDLTLEQLEELTFDYMMELERAGISVNPGDICEADVLYHYHGQLFSDKDFYCSNPAKGVRPF